MQQGLCARELDHVAPVRQLFADSVQRLQALCVDCHSEKTLRESAQPTSLESRVCPGVMEAYVRSPKLPPLVFGKLPREALRGCGRRCRRNGLANAPFPLPILCPADGVEPVEPAAAAVCGPWLVPQSFHCRDAGAVGITFRWASMRADTWARPRSGGPWSAWTLRGPRARSTWPSSR